MPTRQAWLSKHKALLSVPVLWSLIGVVSLSSCFQEDYHAEALRGERLCADCHLPAYNAATSPDHSSFPTTCQDCHTVKAWRPAIGAGHPEDKFPLDGTANHDNLACNDCHDATRGADSADNTNCVGCHVTFPADPTTAVHDQLHMDLVHAQTEGYPLGVREPNYCLDCHPTGSADGGLHDEEGFPIGAGHHSNIECLSCHNETLGTYVAGENTTCAQTCHTAVDSDPYHVNIGGYFTAQQTGRLNYCLSCHANGTATGHPENTFATKVGNHANVGCNDCHDIDPNDAYVAENYPYTDGANTLCVKCHTTAEYDGRHLNAPGYTNARDSGALNFCLQCHPGGQAEGGLHPNNIFPITDGQNHDGFDCANCHKEELGATYAQNITCTGCHTGAHNRERADLQHSGHPGYPQPGVAAPEAFCLDCHTDGKALNHPLQAFKISAGYPHDDVQCYSCHDPNQSNAGGQNVSCVKCHARDGNFNGDVSTGMDDLHQGETNEYPFNDPNAGPQFCRSCHADGTQ